MNDTGIVILCRMGSNRLPGKTLIKINNITVLQRVIDRCKKLKNYSIVVATSTNKEDDLIKEFCLENKVRFFRGESENVAKRFLDCCHHFDFKNAARVNCDRVLLDIITLKGILKYHSKNISELTTNFRSDNLLKGQGCEVIKVSILEKYIHLFNSYEKEHVTKWFYDNPDKISIVDYEMKKYDKLMNMSLDTIDDLERITKWINQLDNRIPDSSIEEIYKLEQNKINKI